MTMSHVVRRSVCLRGWALLVLLLPQCNGTNLGSSSSSSNNNNIHEPSAALCDPLVEAWNTTTQLCECKDGLHGLGCGMCDTAKACQGSLGDQATCHWGLEYRTSSQSKTYQCQPVDSARPSLLPATSLAIQCNRGKQSCTVEAFNATQSKLAEPILRCELTACVFTDGSSEVSCGRTTCQAHEDGSPAVKALTTPFRRAAVTAANDAVVSINFDGVALPLQAVCSASACEVDIAVLTANTQAGNDSPDAPSDSARHWIILVVYGCCGLLVLATVWITCFCKSCMAKYKNIETCSTPSTCSEDDYQWMDEP